MKDDRQQYAEAPPGSTTRKRVAIRLLFREKHLIRVLREMYALILEKLPTEATSAPMLEAYKVITIHEENVSKLEAEIEEMPE